MEGALLGLSFDPKGDSPSPSSLSFSRALLSGAIWSAGRLSESTL